MVPVRHSDRTQARRKVVRVDELSRTAQARRGEEEGGRAQARGGRAQGTRATARCLVMQTERSGSGVGLG
jgi:hypothetical protein